MKEPSKARSSRQMRAAPANSTYVWPLCYLHYPKELASKLDREDLKIVPLRWLHSKKWTKAKSLNVVIDHACQLFFTDEEEETIEAMRESPEVNLILEQPRLSL